MTLKVWRVISQSDAQTAISRYVSHCVADKGIDRPSLDSIFKWAVVGHDMLTRLVWRSPFFLYRCRLYKKQMPLVFGEGQASLAVQSPECYYLMLLR